MFTKEISKNYSGNIPSRQFFLYPEFSPAYLKATSSLITQERYLLAVQPDRISGLPRAALDKVLDDVGVDRSRRNYTYTYGASPADWKIDVGEEEGDTFSRKNAHGDYIWFAYVFPKEIRALAPKLGCTEVELKNLIAIHELAHKNFVYYGLDRRSGEVYAWLAQAYYRPRLVLQTALVRTAIATVRKEIAEDQDFVIESLRYAIAKTFKTDDIDPFLKAVDDARAEEKEVNDKEPGIDKRSTLPQLVDKIMRDIAAKMAERLNGNAADIFKNLYDS
jgi:hypothetical protein